MSNYLQFFYTPRNMIQPRLEASPAASDVLQGLEGVASVPSRAWHHSAHLPRHQFMTTTPNVNVEKEFQGTSNSNLLGCAE